MHIGLVLDTANFGTWLHHRLHLVVSFVCLQLMSRSTWNAIASFDLTQLPRMFINSLSLSLFLLLFDRRTSNGCVLWSMLWSDRLVVFDALPVCVCVLLS